MTQHADLMEGRVTIEIRPKSPWEWKELNHFMNSANRCAMNNGNPVPIGADRYDDESVLIAVYAHHNQFLFDWAIQRGIDIKEA